MKNYRLYLIRHGITQGNLDGIYMGCKTDLPLCEEGKQRLLTLKSQFEYPVVKTLFSSPMHRALETADLLFPEAENKIILDDLRETNFGEFEGRKISELLQDNAFQLWLDPTQKYIPNGGEHPQEFHARCQGVLLKIFEYMMTAGIDTAACITHGGVIMSMMAQRALPQRTPEQWMADSGCGYLLQCSVQMWMRDQYAEATDIIPFGYLENPSA